MACEQGRVFINDRPAKSAATVKVDDTVHLELGSRALTLKVFTCPRKGCSRTGSIQSFYEVIEELKRAPEVLEWLPADEGW